MEKAIFVTSLGSLPDLASDYRRLYLGTEFCERRIPEPSDLQQALTYAARSDLRLTLVTPYLTHAGIGRLAPLIRLLNEAQDVGAEIVINDWGMLDVIRREYNHPSFQLVLGRLLTKQLRDPRLVDMAGSVPQEAVDHFRMANVDVPILSDFLVENGITRVEFDNPRHGLLRKDPTLPGSLYVPFVYLTTTRICPTNSRLTPKKTLRVVLPCSCECQDSAFRLRHKSMPVDLILKGNTIFFRNDAVPDGLPEMKVDRIVFQPEPPL